MKTKFSLVFNDRDDGTKVWAAECQGCGTLIVGERYPSVAVLKVKAGTEMSPVEFSHIVTQAATMWKRARENGTPLVIADDRMVVETAYDHGDLQRALEAHQASCPNRERGVPTMPIPGP